MKHLLMRLTVIAKVANYYLKCKGLVYSPQVNGSSGLKGDTD